MQTAKFLTRAQAAVVLDVSIGTVDNLIERGVLTALRAPGSRLIRLDRAEVESAFAPIGGDAA